MGGALRHAIGRHQQAITLTLASIVLGTICLLPFLAVLHEAAVASSIAVLASARTWALLGRSVLLAAAVSLVAGGIGVPLGLLLGRTDLPGRRVLWLVHAFGTFLPPFLLALGWFQLLGREGWIGNERSSAFLFSTAGFIGILGLTFSPFVTSLVALGVQGVDASLEEAARVSARPARVLLFILLPAAWPALALALIVVFALALSELGVATFLRVDVFAAAVFSRLGGINYAPGEAFTLVLPLLPVAAGLLWLERRFASHRSFAVLGARGSFRAPMPLGRWKAPLAVLTWLLAFVSVAPVLALGLRAWEAEGGFAAVADRAGHAPWHSVLIATLAATVILALGIVVGHATARGSRAAALVDGAAVLSFIMPASALGVGLIAIWNHSRTAVVYTSVAILVLGCVARYSVVGIRVMASLISQTPPHLEEAAAAAGAGYLRRLVCVVVPVRARGAMFAWLAALVFCLRDLETAVLFYPPGREPLPVRIFTLEANGPEPIVAGLAVLHAVLTGFCILLGTAVMHSWKRP